MKNVAFREYLLLSQLTTSASFEFSSPNIYWMWHSVLDAKNIEYE